MIYENWLFRGSLPIKTPPCFPLDKNLKTDCVVIGGGFTGLHAALRLIDSGKEVILLEKDICGSGSSGKSGGFLTPESEKDMASLVKSYGEKKAKIIHDIPSRGVDLIVETIKKYKFDCDFRKQDSFYFSIKGHKEKFLVEDAESREEVGMPYELFNKKELAKIHPGKNYTRGLRYPGSYGINSFAYCQEMKNLLLRKGVKIFEGSEVKGIEENTVVTHLGSVTAKNILICIDKMKNEFNQEVSKKFHTYQTYLAVSEPLTNQEMKFIFPKGELMCWDTKLIYTHYRPVNENRIIIGGGNILTTYYPKEIYSDNTIKKFIKEFKENFPLIRDVNFNHYWSGLIDITQDFEPIVDYDTKNKSIQYAMGCAGLPWAAFCGDYIARRIVNPGKTEDLSEFTRIDRKFLFSPRLQKILGKQISFALANAWGYFKS